MGKNTRVVLTGAAGHLGSHLVALMNRAGYSLHGLDRVPMPDGMEQPGAFTVADLSDREAIDPVLAGADVIVHCASIHPWKQYTDEQYLDANVKGTWQLYAAAASAGVKHIVLTSSIAAVGYGVGLGDRWPISELDEAVTTDLYSVTKQAQENIARTFAQTHGIRTIALRPPAFMPRSETEVAFGLLGCYGVVDDIASAHMAALDFVVGGKPSELFEPVYCTNALPFRAEDAELLENGFVGFRLVEKYWPQAVNWLRENGFTGTWCPAVYSLARAKELLGWAPSTDFGSWFAENGEAN